VSKLWADIAYDWGPTTESFATPKSDADVLRTSIINILMTRKGEYVMYPEFGAGIPQLVFEQNDDVLPASIKALVESAIRRWDDRLAFTVDQVSQNNNELRIKMIFWNVKDPKSNDPYMLDVELTPAGVRSIT